MPKLIQSNKVIVPVFIYLFLCCLSFFLFFGNSASLFATDKKSGVF